MRQRLLVPPAIVETTYDFHNSTVRQQWQRRNVSSPGSICEISFRVVNLHAAVSSGEITDPQLICQKAFDIDSDLESWKVGLPPQWRYATAAASDETPGTYFDGQRHKYPSLWIADAWNNWRVLRIIVNQIIMQNGGPSSLLNDIQRASVVSNIRHMSGELCTSAASFNGTPRRSLCLHSATLPLTFLHRYLVLDETAISGGYGGAQRNQCTFLRHRPAAQAQRLVGRSTSRSVGGEGSKQPPGV